MASEAAVKADIERGVGSNYSIWTIGVTGDPNRSKVEQGNPKHWHQWDADSERAARNLERYFLDKGMKGGGGGPGRADYVYIF